MNRKDREFQQNLIDMLNTRVVSRRSMLRGAAAAGVGVGATGFVLRAAAQNATPGTQVQIGGATEASPVASPVVTFESDVDVLNYALTLEHLESAFYRDGLADLGTDAISALGFQDSVYDNLQAIANHEAAHVETLTSVINDLGGTPVEEGTYDFGYTDAAGFLEVALALEDTGVAAYTGAAHFLIDSDDLLTAALTIHGVEARHASYLALVNETDPFPDATNAPLTPAEVLDIAGPFIVG